MGERDGTDTGSGPGRPDDHVAFGFRCCATDVEATGAEIDVLEPEADEFGPAQAGVGQDGHNVFLIAARGSEPLDFLSGQIPMPFALGNAASRPQLLIFPVRRSR